MKRLIKKTPHRLGLKSWILAYASENDNQYYGKWKKVGKVWVDGKKKIKYKCVASGSVCKIGKEKTE